MRGRWSSPARPATVHLGADPVLALRWVAYGGSKVGAERTTKLGDETLTASEAVRWRRPRGGAYLWLALVGLVGATALGPAPIVVPIGMAIGVAVVYVAMFGPWRWKRSSRWLSVTAPVTRVIAWYGYGSTRAELVLRPRLVWRLILWPLLPWTMYCRVELREGLLISFGHPGQQSPVVIDASTAVRLDRDQRFASALADFYRVLTITHPSGGRLRLTVAVWSHWRQIARIVDPYNRLHLNDWHFEQFDDEDFEIGDLDA